MPRWLSEGISVYEEEKEDPAWGSPITPRYRAMILGDDFTPLSQLSSAFLAPKSGMHLQFAYFESALAVEFLVEKAGLPALRGVLDDLGAGVTINESLPSRAEMTLEQLDAEFAAFARKQGRGRRPRDDLGRARAAARPPTRRRSKPGSRPTPRASPASVAWPPSSWPRATGRRRRRRSRSSRPPIPDYVGEDNAYVLLAAVCRKTSDPAGERAALEALASRDGDAGPAYLRLMELEEASSDWKGLARDARRMLAVNPLVPAPHRALARASEQLGQDAEALAAYRALAILDESDPADTHYRLARLLAKLGQPAEARREVLKSLEEAPRFLEAHKLLLELVGPDPPNDPAPPARRRRGTSR